LRPAGFKRAYCFHLRPAQVENAFTPYLFPASLNPLPTVNLTVFDAAIYARNSGPQTPLHQTLVYPVASNNSMSISYEENREAKPLNKPMMLWFVKHVIDDKTDLKSPLIDLDSADLLGLPPTTVITAGIDLLRSDDEKLAEKLSEAGVTVVTRNYEGVTHEFFGMATVVGAAREAQAFFLVETQRPYLEASGAV
jgi:acetyl esterase/lipase